MFINAAAQKTRAVCLTLGVISVSAAVLIYSESCAEGVLDGIKMCFYTLIPSLFPFMAITSFICSSGLSLKIGKLFEKPTRKLFGLNGCFAPVILLSLIGGYPVGAKGISSLYKNGFTDKFQAEKASIFSVCSGAGFMINFVGMSLYNNKLIGVIIFVSQIISVFLLGCAVNMFYEKKRGKKCDNSKPRIPCEQSVSGAVVNAALDSAEGMLNICTFVILFSAFSGIIGKLTGGGLFKSCALCLLEVCSAVNIISADQPVTMTAFAVGFGGLCVHFQIFSSLGNIKISKLTFFCARIIQGFITAVLTFIGTKLFLGEQTVFSTSTVQHTETYGGTVISGIALVAISLCFLYSFKNCKNN